MSENDDIKALRESLLGDAEAHLNAYKTDRSGSPVTAHLLKGAAKLLDRLEAAEAEVQRLTDALHKSNSGFEHFEREWYLRGDEIERLTAENEALRRDAERWRAVAHVFHITTARENAVMLSTHWSAWVDGQHATVTDAVDAYAADALAQAEKGGGNG